MARQVPGRIVSPGILGLEDSAHRRASTPSICFVTCLISTPCAAPSHPVQALSRPSASSLPSSVPKEQEKSEKVSKRVSAVEEVRSHVKVLQEMLSRYRRPGQAPPDQEALQVLLSNGTEMKEGVAECN